MNIESLLKEVHAKLKPLAEKLGVEGEIYYQDLLSRTDDSKEKDEIAGFLESFTRQVEQLDQSLMKEIQEQLAELGGDKLTVDESIFKVKITADDLELVEREDLEQQVALETMAGKAFENVAIEVNLLNQRLNKVLGKEDAIDDKTNPLGPLRFCVGFGKVARKINVPASQKLTIYRLFELNVLSELGSLLTAANEYLKGQGILPNAEVTRKAPQRPQGERKEQSNEAGEEQSAVTQDQLPPQTYNLPIQNHQPSGLFDINDPMVKQVFELIAKEGYQVLEKLIADAGDAFDSRISSDGVGDQNYAGKQEISEQELVQILDNIQASSPDLDEVPVLEGEFQRANVLDKLGSELKNKSQQEGVATTLSKTGNDKVRLMDMLFEHMESDDYLPDNVKGIISELQVPLTKLALLDESFFSDQNHPGRLLLNELSRTGMAIGKEGVGNEQSIKLLTSTVKEVKDNFKSDTKELEGVLVHLSENLGKQNKKVDALEKRLLEAEKGRAKTEHAQEIIEKLYDNFRARVPVPVDVEEFLNTGWRDVLMMTCLKFGSHSKQWKTDKEITVKFMKSILLAKRARLEGKQMKIPMELLKILKLGLDRISYDAGKTKELLSKLAKTYQAIAATSAEDIQQELMEFGGEASAAKKVFETKVKAKSESSSAEGVEEETVEPAELTEEEEKKLQARQEAERKLQEKIEKEKEVIAASPKEALEDKIKNLDIDVSESVPEIKEIEPEEEFVEGNTWYDMVTQLPIGAWVEFNQDDGSVLRCKIVANIKSLEKLIFANKAGAKVAERKIPDLAKEIKNKKAKIINDNVIFDQALENVISNLRAK